MKRNKTNRAIILSVILIIASGIIYLTHKPQETEQSLSANYHYIQVSSSNEEVPEITALIADTPEKRLRGLSVLKRLKKQQGMLFLFETPSNYPFWMKEMTFPIDILWLNKNGEVVFLKEHAHPDDYPQSYIPPKENVLYVLELQDGAIEQFNILKGDTFSW